MIDIVKRLDRLANAEIIPLTTAWEIAKVASKEITRLREENKMAFEAVGDVVKANDDLREKNEKLRIEVMSDYNEGWEEGLSAMKAENGRIKAAFRVNMLRAFPNMSHEEIDAQIAAAIRVNE